MFKINGIILWMIKLKMPKCIKKSIQMEKKCEYRPEFYIKYEKQKI